jgi:hypothetical protein
VASLYAAQGRAIRQRQARERAARRRASSQTRAGRALARLSTESRQRRVQRVRQADRISTTPSRRAVVRPSRTPTQALNRLSQESRTRRLRRVKQADRAAREQARTRAALNQVINRIGRRTTNVGTYRTVGSARVPSVRELLLGTDEDGKPAYFLKTGDKRMDSAKRGKADQAYQAAGLKVLNQLTRVASGEAEAVKAFQKSKGNMLEVAKGGAKGFVENKSSFRDLTGKKGLGGVAGTALDIGLDPTTYATLGVGSVTRKVALNEAKRVTRKALAQGLSKEQAERMGQRALKRAASKPDKGSGVTVSIAGREAPGVRRATAAAGRGAKRVARPVAKRTERARAAVRGSGSDVNPAVAPAGVPKAEHQHARSIAREARATQQSGRREAEDVATGIIRQIGEANYNRVVDAIEAKTIGQLPENLRGPAVHLRSLNRNLRRRETQAGVAVPKLRTEGKGPMAQEYVPRGSREALEGGEGLAKPVRGSVVKPGHTKTRATHKPMVLVRKETDTYSENLPLLQAARVDNAGRAMARAQTRRQLADLGREVKPGRAFKAPGKGEALYHLKPQKGAPALVRVDPKDYAKVANGKAGSGRFFVANEKLVDQVEKLAAPVERSTLAAGFDKAQAGFKGIATATPGFHIRNLVGDTQNAYLANSLPTVLRNLPASARAIKAGGRQAKGSRKLQPIKQGKGTVKLKGGQRVSYDDLAREMQEHGAMNQGYIRRELSETAGRPEKQIRKTKPKRVRRAIGRGFQAREDVVRGATYIAERKKGKAPREATAKQAEFHFDYGELTPFEKNVGRRVMPFYTFTARNIPLQSKMLVKRPGKFANYEKVRQGAADMGGMEDGWESQLSPFDQRQLPIPIKGQAVSMALPLTDIGEFPIELLTGNPKKQGEEWLARFTATLSPLIKVPIEQITGQNLFFRDQIEPPGAPLKPAPTWVKWIPEDQRNALGIVPDMIDKRTGKKIWGWPGRVDYWSRQIPGLPMFFGSTIWRPSGAKQESPAAMIAKFASGVRAVPIDKNAQSTQINRLYEEKEALEKDRAALSQRGIGSASRGRRETPEYRMIKQRLKEIDAEIAAASRKRGDKIPLGRKKKPGWQPSVKQDAGGWRPATPQSSGGWKPGS